MPDPRQIEFDFAARLTADEQSILTELLRRLDARDERQRLERVNARM